MDYRIFLDYLRMVGYTIIILSSMKNIVNKSFSNILLVGDVIMAFGLLLASLQTTFFGIDRKMLADCVLTPAVVLWAAIHFYDFIYNNHLTSNGYKSILNKGEK